MSSESIRETIDSGLKQVLADFEGESLTEETRRRIERTVEDYLLGVMEAGFVSGHTINKITESRGIITIDYTLEENIPEDISEESIEDGLARILWE